MCSIGYYEPGDGTNNCLACSVKCYNCTSAGCNSCLSTNNRYLNGVTCSCLVGYFDPAPLNNLINPACTPCSYTCMTC